MMKKKVEKPWKKLNFKSSLNSLTVWKSRHKVNSDRKEGNKSLINLEIESPCNLFIQQSNLSNLIKTRPPLTLIFFPSFSLSNFPRDIVPPLEATHIEPRKSICFQTRQVFLGLCLPATCNQASLTSMLRANADRVEREGNLTYRSYGPKIHIVAVRPVPSSNYTLWRDPKFYVLS